MGLTAYPVPIRDGGYSISTAGTRTPSWATLCSDCKHGFSANNPEDAQRMWWEHVRDEHPNAWVALRDDAPELPAASEFHYA